MKIGMRAHDFGRMEPDILAKTIKEAGFDCVQLAPAKAIPGIESFDDITDKLLDNIKSAFDKHNLEITVLGCYIEPSLPCQESRLKNVEIFKNNLEHAKKLGVGIVGTETTGLNIDAPEKEREEAYNRLKDSVLRMVEKAEKENVLVGIEPVAEHTLNTPKITRRLLDEIGSDKLKIIFDPVNLILPHTINRQNDIFNEAFNLFGRDIIVLHIKDTIIENRQKVWSKIGEGVVNYALIFDWLRKNLPAVRLLREEVSLDSYKDDIKILKGALV